MSQLAVRFTNGWAMLFWVGAFAFDVAALVLAGVTVTQPEPVTVMRIVGVIVAALFAVGISIGAVNQPRLTVEVEHDGSLDIVRQWPFRSERTRIAAADVTPAAVAEGTDAEGAPVHTCQIRLPDGTVLNLAEGGPVAMEEVANRFNATAGRPDTRRQPTF